MKETISFDDMIKHVQQKSFTSWFDKFNFFHIMTWWILVIGVFGFCYYFFSGATSFLMYMPQQQVVTKITDAVYFSFITATTTGFGDIIPFGIFKFLAIIEVICVLLLMALVTSKLVSIKQDAILGELYEISFNEQINRLRASFLLFRQNLSRIMTKIEENTLRKREASEMFIYISSLEDLLNETISLIHKPHHNGFTKTIDPVNTELIVNSISSSFDKLYELIMLMNQHKIEWKREVTSNLINKCILLNEKLFEIITSSKYLGDKTLLELKARNTTIINSIKIGTA